MDDQHRPMTSGPGRHDVPSGAERLHAPSEPERWRVARVDRGAITAVPDGDRRLPGTSAPATVHHHGDMSTGDSRRDEATTPDGEVDARTWRTRPDGTLTAVVGEPFPPAVGDWLHVDGDTARVMPRVSELTRDSAGPTSREQVIAANVDTVLIAEPLEPLPALGRIERLLTIAYRCGATPVVVLTKADLVVDAGYWVQQARQVAPGAAVLALSATWGAGIEELRTEVADATTLVLVGPSGAGKSTLVNALAGAEMMETGAVRGDSRGMHTTTHRQLVPLAGGQVLIDTPGLRSIGLVATEESVAATFTDVEALADMCRFRDCGHTSEPDCAVQAAVAQGDLPERRLESWRSLRREARWQATRADARLQSEQNKELRRRSRSARAARTQARI